MRETITLRSSGLSRFSQNYHLFGVTRFVELSNEEFNMVQWYVFQNCEGSETLS